MAISSLLRDGILTSSLRRQRKRTPPSGSDCRNYLRVRRPPNTRKNGQEAWQTGQNRCHTMQNCPTERRASLIGGVETANNNEFNITITSNSNNSKSEETWKIVTFSRKKSQSKRPIQANNEDETGINVKLFHADTCKYLNSIHPAWQIEVLR
ncbi:hypothetical protein HAX54_045128 [Datura stramonium]|uniref:Uncharacterized protein n=1 Tax=Datura stramonium TaxID=4076 RepID=A0ABS8WJD0_DATST|nr:hypothetical protein [Datura stramonium]